MSTMIYPLKAARITILHAQQLAQKNGAEPQPTAENVMALIRKMGCLQIDALQMVQRSHYMLLWSRLGDYPTAVLDQLVYGPERQCFEYWFHAACILPFDAFPYLTHAKEKRRLKPRRSMQAWLDKSENQQLLTAVTERIQQEGGLRAADFKGDGKKRGAWWDWKPAKIALEHLYNCGDLMVADRQKFQRVYDLTERVYPVAQTIKPVSHAESCRWVLVEGARVFGICSPEHLYLYALGKKSVLKPYLQQLLDNGKLHQIQVTGHTGEIYEMIIHPDYLPLLEKAAAGAAKAERTTFLNPFDSFWYPQGRAEQLWGFWQRIEMYKPKGEYRYGYFCLPILYHDQLIGRFDVKMERKSSTLRLKKLYLHDGVQLDDQMISAVAATMRDFLQFNEAVHLEINASEPADFGRQLLRTL